MTKKIVSPAQAPVKPTQQLVSMLEDRCELFAATDDLANANLERVKYTLNRTFSLSTGLAAILTIAAGNDMVKSYFDPADRDSTAPISDTTIANILRMASTVCEMISDDIACIDTDIRDSAFRVNAGVQS